MKNKNERTGLAFYLKKIREYARDYGHESYTNLGGVRTFVQAISSGLTGHVYKLHKPRKSVKMLRLTQRPCTIRSFFAKRGVKYDLHAKILADGVVEICDMFVYDSLEELPRHYRKEEFLFISKCSLKNFKNVELALKRSGCLDKKGLLVLTNKGELRGS